MTKQNYIIATYEEDTGIELHTVQGAPSAESAVSEVLENYCINVPETADMTELEKLAEDSGLEFMFRRIGLIGDETPELGAFTLPRTTDAQSAPVEQAAL